MFSWAKIVPKQQMSNLLLLNSKSKTTLSSCFRKLHFFSFDKRQRCSSVKSERHESADKNKTTLSHISFKLHLKTLEG